MSSTFTIQDGDGERTVGRGAFPLAVGGPGADVRLNGLDGGELLAYLGLSEDDLFVQPASEAASVTCNGTRLTSSHWLEDGDVLRLGPARLVIELEGDEARFVVRETEAGTEPIALTPPPREARKGAKIRPIAFQPARAPSSSGTRRKLGPGTLFAVLFLAALGAAAAFVFTSRSILVEIEPAPDRMEIEGGLALELGGRHLLRPGSYRLVAEKTGFRPLEVPFEVGHEANQTFRYELERLPGLLEVRVGAVDGARILVDGEPRGTTPLDGPLEISPGEHEVRIRADRYREYVSRVTIAGAGVVETLEGELEALWAPVTFSSTPAGATVRVDGATVGRTPVTAEVVEGDRAFEVLLAGYKPHRGHFAVAAGEARSVPVTLVPSDGNVVLLSEPDGAAVTVDGAYRGEAPIELALEPGRPHLVQVSKAGYGPETRQVEVAPDEARELTVALTPQEGEVTIAAWPSDAELWVDGERRPKANGTLRLAAVAHEIELRKPGFAPYRTTVTPMPDIPKSIEVSLKSIEEKKAEAVPGVIETAEGHELRRVEPGRFLMGASRREPGRRANEALREVELTRAFYLATREVSNEQYRRYDPDHLSGQVAGRTLDIEDHPVVNVTWEEAAQYCNWLSAREELPPAYVMRDGKLVLAGETTTGYRLPTEAEWAWAARFPDGKAAVKFPWGESLPVPPASGNFADLSAKEILPGVLMDYDDGHAVTSPVTAFPANALGIFNLGGNVAEWIHDYYSIRPAGSDKVARDPFGPEDGELHVIRGSSWMHSTVTELRLTYRDYGDKPRPDLGFRIARYVE